MAWRIAFAVAQCFGGGAMLSRWRNAFAVAQCFRGGALA
jgi:hypothetical protein